MSNDRLKVVTSSDFRTVVMLALSLHTLKIRIRINMQETHVVYA